MFWQFSRSLRSSAPNKLVATPHQTMLDSPSTEKAMTWIVSDADHLGGKPRVRGYSNLGSIASGMAGCGNDHR